MEVFKFGGASIVDKAAIINVANIIEAQRNGGLVVVISAKGKTTNKLEQILAKSGIDTKEAKKTLGAVIENHLELGKSLGITSKEFVTRIEELQEKGFYEIENLESPASERYDSLVSIGELLSTSLVYFYLKEQSNLNVEWLDIRDIVKTDNSHTEAKILWTETAKCLENKRHIFTEDALIITQGFIGTTLEGITTTLGREGSDYTASVLAYLLDLKQLTIWKDVEGILTGDPRIFDNVKLLPRISYREAIEMTYYGAKVIHPKTIKPLQNKGILLRVKSFKQPDREGTIIGPEEESVQYPPIVVVEKNQSLIRFGTNDFSFIAEEHLSEIFEVFDRHRVKVNMMRNGAISFSVCLTNKSDKISRIVNDLESNYQISIEKDLELLTIRHPNDQLISHLETNKLVLFKELIADTVRILTKPVAMIKRKKN